MGTHIFETSCEDILGRMCFSQEIGGKKAYSENIWGKSTNFFGPCEMSKMWLVVLSRFYRYMCWNLALADQTFTIAACICVRLARLFQFSNENTSVHDRQNLAS